MAALEGKLATYQHTQKGPWHLLLYAVAAVFLVAAWSAQGPAAVDVVLLASGFAMLLLGTTFCHLTVEDEGRQLLIRFGPFPLWRKRIWYDDILEAKKGRTIFLDGWGIHWSPWGGWLWNIWGFDCVVIRLKRRTLRIGTDDPDRLVEFLNSRTGRESTN
jgi:hypothetical protein